MQIINCYLDYSVLEIVHPKMNLIQGNFFYNAHAVLQVGLGEATDLIMRENIYSLGQYGGSESVVLAGADRWSKVHCAGVVVEDDIDGWQGSPAGHSGTTIRSTRVRRSITQTDATEWVFDVSNSLLFSSIDTIQYSLVLTSPTGSAAAVIDPPPTHAAYQLNGTAVKVVTAAPVSATVYLEVAECSDWR